jgi:predicted nucleic acid-binding protein
VPPPVFVDSSGWIAHLSRRDRHHAEAGDLFRRAVAERARLLTTDLVLAEIHRLILFRAGRAAALAALEKISNLGSVEIEWIERSHHDEALRWIRRFDDPLFTFADATSFAVMKARKCRHVIGFDRHFEIAGFERWSRGRR